VSIEKVGSGAEQVIVLCQGCGDLFIAGSEDLYVRRGTLPLPIFLCPTCGTKTVVQAIPYCMVITKVE